MSKKKQKTPERIVLGEGYAWVRITGGAASLTTDRDGCCIKVLVGRNQIDPVARYRLVLERVEGK